MAAEPVGLALLAAHMLADFPLQSDEMARNKLDDVFVRAIHSGVHGVASALMLTPFWGVSQATIVAAWVVVISHFIIDSRRWAEPKEGFEDYPIWVDQSLHIGCLVIALQLGGAFL